MQSVILELIKLGSVGIIAGLFASFMANRDFRHKKWWELRVSAYQNAIEALSDIVHYYEVHKNTWDTNNLTDEQKQFLNVIIGEARPKIRKLADTGSFLFSEDANTALRAFIDFRVGEIIDPDDYYGPLKIEASKCLKKLVTLSKKDLKVRNVWL
ncbi:hypothetical protein [Pseudoalteromonas sp. BSi20429]|uniref:hypothetical protein n=1 Tax=Pseudoalteromonas sp. BSi20429 TaxID=1097676 RepID=UPI000231A227|nr:hypothetical protein [Pseudoalteromonas sp. BSi20429]GAA66141.1 hypothetical protein P20429_0239 [Pseudoalteromonas sp. BSi20429]